MSVRDEIGPAKTAFVFAGGGSFGAIQVGMLHSLASHGIAADMVVGSSVGALNGAFYAGDPTLKGVLQLEDIWRGLHRHEAFAGAPQWGHADRVEVAVQLGQLGLVRRAVELDARGVIEGGHDHCSLRDGSRRVRRR